MDLFFGSDWFMYVVEAAIITGILGMIGILIKVLFDNQKSSKEVNRRIGNTEDKGSLTGQHEAINKAVANNNELISKTFEEAKLGYSSAKDALLEIRNVKEKFIEETTAQKYRHENLSEKQKDIKSQVNAIELMAGEWESLITENKELREALSQARQEIMELNETINALESEHGHELE